MNCKNCIHWKLPKESEFFGAEECAMPRNPASEDFDWEYIDDENEQRRLFGHATKFCRSPKVKFYERPDKSGACVADGSQYMASLITGEDFGCVNFEGVANGS
jgi:hypothetical protein